jgi:hypothetical protein
MNNPAGVGPLPWSEVVAGTLLGPLHVTVSPTANERYWRAAGVDHPALRAGACYPPIAANLTVLAFGQRCHDPMIQTRQRLVCHGRVEAGEPLVVTGRVLARYDKRGRTYVDVHAQVATEAAPDSVRWESEVTFTPAATLRAR